MAQKLISRQKPGSAVPTQQHNTLQDGPVYRNYGGKKSILLLRKTGYELFSFENN
jgi:hypothetical protein